MRHTLEGRLRNVALDRTKGIFALYEAVVNAIEAIDESKRPDGEIYVDLLRPYESGLGDGEDSGPITSITITDNGVGFTDDNYDSFCTFDTLHKVNRGGKGVGRFTWLKVFGYVSVTSYHHNNGNNACRTFKFYPRGEGIEEHEVTICEGQEQRTIVTLHDMHLKYREDFPKTLDAIAQKIIEHCLIRFLAPSLPKVYVKDKNQTIDLKSVFNNAFCKGKHSFSLNINDNQFLVNNVKLYGMAPWSKHRIVYCANHREVMHENLEKHIPDMQKKLTDEDGNSYCYSAYVSGAYLDEIVKPERTGFAFDEEDSLFHEPVLLRELRTGVVGGTKEYLKHDLVKVKTNKLEDYSRYIKDKAPQYRFMLKHYPNIIEELPPSLSDSKLDIELYKAKSELTVKVRKAGQALLKKKIENIEDVKAYAEEYNNYLSAENEVGKATLAEYVSHRKIILSLLQNVLKINKEGKYSKEDAVHRLVYPLRTTSDDIDISEQNLWIIDERLSYHRFLASDKPFDEITEIGDFKSKDRADLLIFNTPLALVDQNEVPYPSISIVEFKRPMRDHYREEDNPIKQIIRYVRNIRGGYVKDINGRQIKVSESTTYFGYLICDWSDKIENWADEEDFTKTPDGLGYFHYHKKFKIYIEIITFDKLLQDAEKRNRILFDKLNIL